MGRERGIWEYVGGKERKDEVTPSILQPWTHLQA